MTGHQPVRGLELRFRSEAEWSRMALADVPPLTPPQRQRLPQGPDNPDPNPLPDGVDIRESLWMATPAALTSVASAASSLVTQGLSVFKVVKDGKVRQRHSVSAYWKSRGVKLTWRIEF